jgi:hypothetical protein
MDRTPCPTVKIAHELQELIKSFLRMLHGPDASRAVFSKSWPMSGGAAQFYRNKHLKVIPFSIDH